MKRSQEPRMRCVLTCPGCGFSGKALDLVPGKVVRCEICGALMVAPRGDGSLPASMAPAADVFPVGRLLLAAVLLSACLLTGIVLMGLEGLHPGNPSGLFPKEDLPTGRDWVTGESLLPLPLGEGVGWTYRLERGCLFTEEVVRVHTPDPEMPRFRIRSSLGSERNVEVRGDGVYLISERTAEGFFEYQPACLLVPLPLYADSRWEASGERVSRRGASCSYQLSFSAAPEELFTSMGRRPTVRIEVEGMRGGHEVRETVWYALGLGRVRFDGPRQGEMVRVGIDRTGERPVARRE